MKDLIEQLKAAIDEIEACCYSQYILFCPEDFADILQKEFPEYKSQIVGSKQCNNITYLVPSKEVERVKFDWYKDKYSL